MVLAACDRAETSDATTLSSLTHAAVPGDDAPELAQPGPYRVGVRTLEFSYEGAPDISVASHITGSQPTWTRHLTIDVLYPANISDALAADAIYKGGFHTGLTEIEGLPKTFEVQGMARRDAPAVEGQQFPLILVSHGLLNTPGVLSGLTENLASKGYVVAAIDHRDAADEPATPAHLFARVLLNRVPDQRRALADILSFARAGETPLSRLIDVDSIGLIGFSMGGYGVLGHAGAGFDAQGSALDVVPAQTIADQIEGSAPYNSIDRSTIGAVIAFAPWGGKPGDVWTDQALGNIQAPLLIFAGSQDDVSDFDQGIQRIFSRTVGTNRHMLVFQNAQHNLVQVSAPPSAHLDVRSWMTFEDPTWRRQRLISVGVHFSTAFLDWKLKGLDQRSTFFDVPTVASNDGSWEQSFLEDANDQYANGKGESSRYWPGFKPRQAIGLELHYKGKDAQSNSED